MVLIVWLIIDLICMCVRVSTRAISLLLVCINRIEWLFLEPFRGLLLDDKNVKGGDILTLKVVAIAARRVI